MSASPPSTDIRCAWLKLLIASVITRMPPYSYSTISKASTHLDKQVSMLSLIIVANVGSFSSFSLDSIGYPFSLSREKFSHPVFIITGDRDAPFCAGNCSANSADPGVTQLDGGRKLFPSVKSQDFDTHVIPDTGHGINFRQFNPLEAVENRKTDDNRQHCRTVIQKDPRVRHCPLRVRTSRRRRRVEDCFCAGKRPTQKHGSDANIALRYHMGADPGR